MTSALPNLEKHAFPRLTKYIMSAPNLTSLALDLGKTMPEASNEYGKGVGQLLGEVTGLKKLSLRSMACPVKVLRAVLTNNATTLWSLELGLISLIEGGWRGGWVPLIRFLHSALKLRHVCLDERLGEDTGEGWAIHPIGDGTAPHSSAVHHGRNYLRSRIAQYILTGGDCPIPDDYEYEDWTVDRRGDHTWHSWECDSMWDFFVPMSSHLCSH